MSLRQGRQTRPSGMGPLNTPTPHRRGSQTLHSIWGRPFHAAPPVAADLCCVLMQDPGPNQFSCLSPNSSKLLLHVRGGSMKRWYFVLVFQQELITSWTSECHWCRLLPCLTHSVSHQWKATEKSFWVSMHSSFVSDFQLFGTDTAVHTWPLRMHYNFSSFLLTGFYGGYFFLLWSANGEIVPVSHPSWRGLTFLGIQFLCLVNSVLRQAGVKKSYNFVAHVVLYVLKIRVTLSGRFLHTKQK